MKQAFSSVPKWTIEDYHDGLPLALRLLLELETVKTETFPKRIVKYTVFPCMLVKESVSGFYESVDSVVSLACTKLLENQLQRILPLAV